MSIVKVNSIQLQTTSVLYVSKRNLNSWDLLILWKKDLRKRILERGREERKFELPEVCRQYQKINVFVLERRGDNLRDNTSGGDKILVNPQKKEFNDKKETSQKGQEGSSGQRGSAVARKDRWKEVLCQEQHGRNNTRSFGEIQLTIFEKYSKCKRTRG